MTIDRDWFGNPFSNSLHSQRSIGKPMVVKTVFKRFFCFSIKHVFECFFFKIFNVFFIFP